ncbi:MAG: outer membrane beta-barrel protein [Bacteroidota bacterium]
MANASENRSYEERWRQTFEQAEMPPSPSVWKNIDQQLTAQESGKYKRGFFFYRAVAAVLLLCIAGLGWYTLTRSGSADSLANRLGADTEQAGKIVTNKGARPGKPGPTADSENGSVIAQQPEAKAMNERSETEGTQVQENESNPGQVATDENQPSVIVPQSGVNNPPKVNEQALASSGIGAVDEEGEEKVSGTVVTGLPPSKTLIFPNEEVSPGSSDLPVHNHQVGGVTALPPDVLELVPPTWAEDVEELYFVPQYREETKQGKEKKGAQFFAGLAMAPSLFDPNFQSQNPASSDFGTDESFDVYSLSASPPSLLNAADRQNDSDPPPGSEDGLENQANLSFSYGVDIGFTLGEHWSIESGVDFQNFQTQTSHRYVTPDPSDPSSGKRLPVTAFSAVANEVRYSTPIGNSRQLNNQFQFISVPLQIAYNVQVNRFIFSLSPGVAANLFLEHRTFSDQYASDEISRGSSGPFNSQYISGLISGGVFYRLVEHYSLSFTPSYYFALTDMTNSTVDFSSQPQSFGLKLGFRYTFE